MDNPTRWTIRHDGPSDTMDSRGTPGSLSGRFSTDRRTVTTRLWASSVLLEPGPSGSTNVARAQSWLPTSLEALAPFDNAADAVERCRAAPDRFTDAAKTTIRTDGGRGPAIDKRPKCPGPSS